MRRWMPYCGEAPDPQGWAAAWNFAPELILVVGASLACSLLLREPRRRAAALAATALFAFLYVSPFCAMGSALFAVRIVHDIVLAMVLAPLLAFALRLDRLPLPGSLAGWTATHAVTFLLWHAPAAYAGAMGTDLVFWLMQMTITGTAAIWWAKVVRAPAPAAAIALLATMVAMGLLGALLAFAQTAFYAPHWFTVQRWGMTPIEDQQLAGILMWAPASAGYLLAAMAVLYRWLGRRALA